MKFSLLNLRKQFLKTNPFRLIKVIQFLNLKTFKWIFWSIFIGNFPTLTVLSYILDKNECTESDTCQNGVCRNLKGSFQCTCNDGYVATKDKKGCIGTLLLKSFNFLVAQMIGRRNYYMLVSWQNAAVSLQAAFQFFTFKNVLGIIAKIP